MILTFRDALITRGSRQVDELGSYRHTVLKDSTADEDRMVEALDSAASKGPFSPPLVGSTLKYGWPGAITETVSAAYLGDPLVDPDNKMRTFRTECSSFIWQSFNAAATGVEIEGQLEDNDLAFSGMFQTAVDGLYGYTSQQRKAAANTLFGQVYNIAQEKGGTPAKILADIGLDYPSAVANFVTNCFAFDDCANPNARWRDDGVGEGGRHRRQPG